MDCYHVWCNLAPGTGDLEFAESVRRYLDALVKGGHLVRYRVTRCKLGLRPSELREWHLTLDFEDLAQLQRAFEGVAARRDPIEGLHHAVNAVATDLLFALYRDFPDDVRGQASGEERF